MANKKEMSIDDLAIIINRSYDRVERRLEKLEDGQERLEAGQKEIKQEIGFAARKFEVKELEVRVEKLEYKFAKMAK